MSRMSAIAARTAVASGLVLAMAAPAVASAAPASADSGAPAKIVRTYDVRVNDGVLAKGSTVQAKAVVSNPESSVQDWWSKGTIAKVVRKGVNGTYEMPYTSQGYRCTPSVNGQTASFTCKLRGGDVATTIKLTFNARYAG
jgi:hypothetical protein